MLLVLLLLLVQQSSAAANCVSASNPAVCFHEQGQHADARRFLQADAEKGNVNGMMNLAFYMATGQGGPEDHAGAVKW